MVHRGGVLQWLLEYVDYRREDTTHLLRIRLRTVKNALLSQIGHPAIVGLARHHPLSACISTSGNNECWPIRVAPPASHAWRPFFTSRTVSRCCNLPTVENTHATKWNTAAHTKKTLMAPMHVKHNYCPISQQHPQRVECICEDQASTRNRQQACTVTPISETPLPRHLGFIKAIMSCP